VGMDTKHRRLKSLHKYIYVSVQMFRDNGLSGF
jgi:hypothetical protein